MDEKIKSIDNSLEEWKKSESGTNNRGYLLFTYDGDTVTSCGNGDDDKLGGMMLRLLHKNKSLFELFEPIAAVVVATGFADVMKNSIAKDMEKTKED